jgi:hypothetical protein
MHIRYTPSKSEKTMALWFKSTDSADDILGRGCDEVGGVVSRSWARVTFVYDALSSKIV